MLSCIIISPLPDQRARALKAPGHWSGRGLKVKKAAKIEHSATVRALSLLPVLKSSSLVGPFKGSLRALARALQGPPQGPLKGPLEVLEVLSKGP